MNDQHLIGLQIDNFKRIELVHLTFDAAGGVFVIGGENEQGKSSAIDALAASLGGRDFKPEMPVRAGAEFAQVIAETEDLVITAKWTEKSYKVIVENRDGSRHRAPQTVLDSFYTSFAIDPEEFQRMSDKEKVAVLRKLTGIETGALDAEYATVYGIRTDVNRERDIYEKQAKGLAVTPAPEGEIEPEVSVVELSKKKSEAMTTNTSNERLRQQARNTHATVRSANELVGLKLKYIADLEAKLEAELATLAQYKTAAQDAIDKCVKASDEAEKLADVDTSEIDREMDAAAAKNKARNNKLFQLAEHKRTKKQFDDVSKTASDKATEADRLTTELKALEAKKKLMFGEAKLPVDGLTFNDDGIFVNKIPFSQISSSEQIRLSLAMAAATKPKLRLILVKNGDLLGDAKLRVIDEWARANDMRVLMERRSSEGTVGVVLVNGRVSEGK